MECKQLWEILTRKQLAMAALVSRGCSTAEVGAIIGNSYEKTKQIMFEIYNRTSLNRVELALRFLHEEQDGDIETLCIASGVIAARAAIFSCQLCNARQVLCSHAPLVLESTYLHTQGKRR